MTHRADLPIPGRWAAAALLTSVMALALLMHGAGLTIDPYTRGTLAFGIVFAILGAMRWTCRHPTSRRMRIARDIAEYFGLFTAVSLIGALASYPIAAFSHGFVDPALQRIDIALGFDWLHWYGIVSAHPTLQHAGRAAYAMIYVSPALLLGHYAIVDRRRAAIDFIAAIWLAALITLIAFRFMPAIGPFGYLWHAPIPYLPVSDLWQPDLIPRLRDGDMTVIDPGHLVGLVSAPSFHAAAGVLLIAFAAREPVVRAPLIAFNLAMLLATPVEGTHYLIDLLLGAAVAMLSIGIIAILRRRAEAEGKADARFRRSARPSRPETS